MCCVLSLCIFGCAVCSYMYTYRQASLPFPVLAIFISFSHFDVFVSFWGSFVWLQLRSFAFVGNAQPSLGASASPLFLSFSVCVVSGLYFYFCCFWPVSDCLFVWLVLCLAGACLGQTATPTAGRDCPPVKAPSQPLGLGCLLKPFIFPDSPGLGLVRHDTQP